jgi:hypothetical protein
MKRSFLLFVLAALFTAFTLQAREYHVSVYGDDQNKGTQQHPFRTIGKAAENARPGDEVIVHGGVYREWVNPPRGGESDKKRIVYRAVDGEEVVIKGSEVIKGWTRFSGDVWKVIIPNSFFGDFNPFKEILHGDWFNDKGRIHHAGEVYLNGRSLYEAPILEALLKQELLPVGEERLYPWYCESDDENTYIYANFGNHDPNREEVEINVRQSCFYPDKPGINYITVKGFVMRQAATPWAPPTAEQPGLLGTHWSKGWIIENNIISDSKCVGITLGKDRKTGQNVWSKNPCKDGATHYNEVIMRALQEGWSKENIGSHIVRNNTIYNCEQAGIVGSLGAVFSTICNNHIYDIWTKRLFTGAEIAGIKIHAAVDGLICHNRIHNAGRGIWLDWMAQGTRVTGNLCYDNSINDLFVEVSHGPFLVDNNLFLSPESIRNWSEGGAFVHNLITGRIRAMEVRGRFTPYLYPHSTRVMGLRNVIDGEELFINNLFLTPVKGSQGKKEKDFQDKDFGLQVYDPLSFTVKGEGNVYTGVAKPCKLERNALVLEEFDGDVRLSEEEGNLFVDFSLPDSVTTFKRPLVTTAYLGKTRISRQLFEDPDGDPLILDKDYNGIPRNRKNPAPGPFAGADGGTGKWKVW